MDELRVVSGFTNGLLSKLVGMLIRKKYGYDINLKLRDVRVSITDEKAFVHLDANLELSKGDLMKLLKKLGLE